jgi:uncharacterized SAM-binding protein YcdF (DUF218 family)
MPSTTDGEAVISPQTLRPRRGRWRRGRWRAGLLGVASIGLILVAVPTAMVLFPHDDEPRAPDGILVLGGIGRERIDLAIELAERYDVPLVLSSSATWFANDRGYRCSLGNALCLQRPFATSTAEEARHTADFMDEQDWDHITVVTSSHHTARARILFRQCLADRVSVVGAPRPETIPVEDRGRPWAVTGVKPLERVREVAGIFAAVSVRRAC